MIAFWLFAAAAAWAADSPFVVAPYLQPGNQQQLTVLWHTADEDAAWTAEYQTAGSSNKWRKAEPALLRTVAVKDIAPHRVYGVVLAGLPAGKPVRYRIARNGSQVFAAETRARKAPNQPYRFVVFGDCAQGTDGQKAIAFQTWQAKPDFVAVAGDIVYSRGLISEYRKKFFPIYNTETAAKTEGAPLLRSVPFFAAPGNHDVAGGNDLGKYPDGLAYYLYWAQPLNGPVPAAGFTPLIGEEAALQAFRKSAGAQYPRMANFSFDYGNSHWTVIDSNKYVDWSAADLLDWLKKDLASARAARWRFVLFHHPGFNSSKAHFGDQWMRLLAPVFEEAKVDVVFAGHVHNYQRSYPMTFVPEPGKWRAEVKGQWTLDKTYDGAKNTRPKGVIYLVTGAGGAGLYNPEQSGANSTWQEFTTKFVSTIHSMTQVDINGNKLTARQVDAEGREVDRFVLTK